MDREKVIKGLKEIVDDKWMNNHADWYVLVCEDALALLEEQDAELSYREAKPITHTATKLDDATCPSCGNVVGEKQIWDGRQIFIQWKYCIFCGQKLEWESR